MLTLPFAQMAYAVAHQWSAVTGGTNGLSGIPRPAVPGVDLGSTLPFYYLVLVLCAGAALLLWRIVRSPFGAALVGVRENEARMRALGFDTFRLKVVAFVIAGAAAALSGTLYAYYNGFVSPDVLYWTTSGQVLIMVLLGGAGTLVDRPRAHPPSCSSRTWSAPTPSGGPSSWGSPSSWSSWRPRAGSSAWWHGGGPHPRDAPPHPPVRGDRGPARCHPLGRPGGAPRRHRPQRRREDHPLQRHLGRTAPHPGTRDLGGDAGHRSAPPPHRRPRPLPDLPAQQPPPQPHRPGERAARGAGPHLRHAAPPHARRAPPGAHRRRARPPGPHGAGRPRPRPREDALLRGTAAARGGPRPGRSAEGPAPRRAHVRPVPRRDGADDGDAHSAEPRPDPRHHRARHGRGLRAGGPDHGPPPGRSPRHRAAGRRAV